MYNVLRLLEGLPALLFIIFLIIFNAVAAAKKKSGNGSEARRTHLTTIGSNFEQSKKIIETYIEQHPDMLVSDTKSDKAVSNRRNNVKRLNKATEEKTHDHQGELRIDGTGLIEDRQNDWLAKQIREETRLHRRQM